MMSDLSLERCPSVWNSGEISQGFCLRKVALSGKLSILSVASLQLMN